MSELAHDHPASFETRLMALLRMRKLGDGMHGVPPPEEASFETPQGRLLRMNYGRLEGGALTWPPARAVTSRSLRQFRYGFSNAG